MKTRVLPLVLLLGLLTAGGLWLLRDSEHEPEASAVGADGGSQDSSRVEADRPAVPEPMLTEIGSEGSGRRAADTPAATVAPNEDGQELITGGRWIDVQVELAAGTPADEELEVFLIAEGADGWAGSLPWMLQEEGPLLMDAATAQREAQKDSDIHYFAKALSADERSARLPFPDEARTAWVMLVGRYSFVPAAEKVDSALIGQSVVLRPELGACLQGRLRLPQGAAELGISAEEISGELALQALGVREGATGMSFLSREQEIDGLEFELRGLPTGFECRLVPIVDGLLGESHKLASLTAGEEHQVELVLRIGGRVRGRVLSPDGEPIPGATVGYHGQVGIRFGTRSNEIEPGADGSFELTGAPGGELKVFAKAEGFQRSEMLELDMPEDGLIEGVEIVLVPGGRIAGRVLWPDGSAASATVKAHGVESRGPKRFTHEIAESNCDEEGRFEFTGLEDEGPFWIEASCRERPSEQEPDLPEEARPLWIAGQTMVEADSGEVELTLGPSLGIAGRVIDDQGEPIADFEVRVHRGDPDSGGMGTPSTREFTDAAGAFFVDGFGEGSWRVSARAEGHHAQEEPLDAVTVVLPGELEPIELVLSRSASLSGQVVDPFGAPVAGAELEAAGARSGMGLMAAQAFEEGRDELSAMTDSEGNFSIEGLAPGVLALQARSDDWAVSESTPVDLAPGAHVEGLVIGLREGGRIVGEAFDESGDPLPGQQITLGENAFMMGFGSDGASETTNAAGGFVFEHVDPGKWVVAIPPPPEAFSGLMDDEVDSSAVMDLMSQIVTETVTVADGEEVHVRLGAEPKSPVRVHGRVLEAGSPVSEGMVIAISEGSALMQGMKMAEIGEDGLYEVSVDRPGAYVFGVQGAGADGIEFQLDVPETEEHEYDLELPMGAIAGTVFGPDGQPAASVSVSLSTKSSGVSLSMDFGGGERTEADGRFVFEHLRPGEYELRAGGTGRFLSSSDEPLGVVVVSNIQVEDDSRVEGIEIHIGEAGSVTGTVQDENGDPVGGVTIFVRDAEGRALSRLSTTVSSPSGQFTYRGISPGRVSVSARGDGLATIDSAAVEVRAGESSEVELSVLPATILFVTVEDGEGTPLRASVQVLDQDGLDVGGLHVASELEATMSEGFDSKKTRVGPLPPGKYKVIATTRDGRSEDKPVKLTGKPERKIKIRIRD